MSLPPGLLPDSNEPRTSRPPLLFGAVVAIALLAVLGLLVQNRKLANERDDAVQRLLRNRSIPSAAPPASGPALPTPTAFVPVPTPPVIVAELDPAPVAP